MQENEVRSAPKAPLAFRESGNGVPLIWLHPFPFSGAIYDQQLTLGGIRHIVPDLRGFGDSAATAAAESIDDYAGDVIALADSLELAQFAVAGVSMGGYVALSLARRSPERLTALILADTKATADTDEARTNRFKLIERLESEGASALVDAMFSKMLAPDTYSAAPAVAGSVRARMLRTPVPAAVAALRAMAARPESSDVLGGWSKPALLIVGASDAITPPADAERMHALLPSSRMHVIAGAGHLAMFEQPRAFNAAVSAFVRDLQ